MTKLDCILYENYVGGSRGEWYYHVEIGYHIVQGGYFHLKRDALRHMRKKVISYFHDYYVAEEFFVMRHHR